MERCDGAEHEQKRQAEGEKYLANTRKPQPTHARPSLALGWFGPAAQVGDAPPVFEGIGLPATRNPNEMLMGSAPRPARTLTHSGTA
ncbi:hypothetical protein MEX01_42500 [Methylorubrum extorquens]|nr:hypothetical protein MEX01_42500 [Methylorubrum extorquens]